MSRLRTIVAATIVILLAAAITWGPDLAPEPDADQHVREADDDEEEAEDD